MIGGTDISTISLSGLRSRVFQNFAAGAGAAGDDRSVSLRLSLLVHHFLKRALRNRDRQACDRFIR